MSTGVVQPTDRADLPVEAPLDEASTTPPRWYALVWGNRKARVGIVLLGFFVLVAVLAPVIAPYPPLKADFRAMQKPPSEKHWFGTDQVGRDTLSRVIYGSQTSLMVGNDGTACHSWSRVTSPISAMVAAWTSSATSWPTKVAPRITERRSSITSRALPR